MKTVTKGFITQATLFALQMRARLILSDEMTVRLKSEDSALSFPRLTKLSANMTALQTQL